MGVLVEVTDDRTVVAVGGDRDTEEQGVLAVGQLRLADRWMS